MLRRALVVAGFAALLGRVDALPAGGLVLPQALIALAGLSPLPERVAAREAWRRAEAFVASRADCEVMVGRGGSMLPLYLDRTVLVVQRLPLSELRSGMTVVFVGDRGRLVAHTLQTRTARGWRVRGLANAKPDRTFVKHRNYLGAVVRAFTPVPGLPAAAPVGVAIASAE